uniref:Uncharacterized protein n=1 Tax=Anguilla anguilla TaxID=7936 RepID=A0A0E9QR49_ANGAN
MLYCTCYLFRHCCPFLRLLSVDLPLSVAQCNS